MTNQLTLLGAEMSVPRTAERAVLGFADTMFILADRPEITVLEQVTAELLSGHDGYRAILALPGIGPVLGAVIVAEIGTSPGSLTRPGCPAGPG